MGILDYLAGGGGIIGTVADNNLRMKQEEEKKQQLTAMQAAMRSMFPQKQVTAAMAAAQAGQAPVFNSLLDYNKPPTPQAPPAFIQEMQYMGVPKDKWADYYSQIHAKSGMSIRTNPDGTMSFEQGPGVGGLQKTTLNKVEEGLLDFGKTKMQLNEINTKFKPEYQTVGTRMGNDWTALKDKINPESLTPQEKAGYEDFSNYRAAAGQMFADVVKQMAGTAMTPAEAKRQEVYLPNPGTGYFDGDSPTQLKTKVERLTQNTNNAMARMQYIRRNGELTIEDVPLEQMPKIIRERGDEIERTLQAQGLTGAPLKNAVRKKISEEFGL